MPFSDTRTVSKAHGGPGAEEKIRRKLGLWFKRHGRILPWRQTRDPYAIMVSEFMLQQTTVAAVTPYFARWMERFPTVAVLAAAEEREVFALWQGLGYYSRARTLHRAARAVMEQHQGKIPRKAETLRDLPGVGGYTSAAIAAFAFDAVEPVIDANIARVLARLKNWGHPIDDARGTGFLQTAATGLLPEKGGRLHNSALMELGALICTARNPRCPDCPVRQACRAVDPGSLPVKRARQKTEDLREFRGFIFHRGKLWLEESAGPRWKGLWLLPAVQPEGRKSDHIEIHPITRFRVTMELFSGPRRNLRLTGFSPTDLPPMPSPHRRAVAAMLKKRHAH